MEDNSMIAKIWIECDARISSLGSSTHARKCRNRYFASDITDERYEQIFAIVAAEIRQSLEIIFNKYDVSADDIEKVSRVKRSRTVKQPKSNEWLTSKSEKPVKVGKFSVVDADALPKVDETT